MYFKLYKACVRSSKYIAKLNGNFNIKDCFKIIFVKMNIGVTLGPLHTSDF